MTYVLPNLLEQSAFLRERQLVGNANSIGLLPISRATLWRRVKDGTFPQPVKLSERTTAWPTVEVRKWMSNPSDYRVDVARNLTRSRTK